MAFCSASLWLWAHTQALVHQLGTEYEAAAALCRKMGVLTLTGVRSCKELREKRYILLSPKEANSLPLSTADLALLGTLGSGLPALKWLAICKSAIVAGPDGVPRLVEGLGAGTLQAVTHLRLE